MKLPSTISNKRIDQAVAAIQRLTRSRAKLKTVMPEDVRIMKTKLAGLDQSMFEVVFALGAILGNGAASMGEISRTLDVPLSTATRTVDWFVENGYAARSTDPVDRRVVRVALTPAGEKIYAATQAFLRKRVETILSEFTSRECDTFVKLVNKIVDVLEAETKKEKAK